MTKTDKQEFTLIPEPGTDTPKPSAQGFESTDPTKPGPKNIPIEAIIEYRNKGLNHREIAELVGCNRSSITQRLQTVEDQITYLPYYKRHKADLLSVKGAEILNELTPDKLQKASAYQLTGMFGIINTHERLERDKTTANVGVVIATVDAIQAQEDHDSCA